MTSSLLSDAALAAIRTVERRRRLAVALWNIERREMQGLEERPPFYCYKDGKGEPMPLGKQEPQMQRYWYARARRLLRALAGRQRGVGMNHEPTD